MIDAFPANGAPAHINGLAHIEPKDAVATRENIADLLANDRKIKVAGVDSDGILRGKIMSKEKFLASVDRGFAMSSAVFGWDMHDALYTSGMASSDEGYSDLMAIPDLASFRRLPFEENIPFVLLHFASNDRPVPGCGRSMIRSLCGTLAAEGMKAMAGGTLLEAPDVLSFYEFYEFETSAGSN